MFAAVYSQYIIYVTRATMFMLHLLDQGWRNFSAI